MNGTSTLFAVEMTAVYGCPTTKEVLETTRIIGRIQEITRGYLIPRMDVKMHLLGRTNLKDSHIIAHLVGRFAKSSKNHGKGTKKEPDYFYGIKADIWQAFAVGVTLIDKLNQNQNIRR